MVERRRPGVVVDDERVARMRDLRDDADIRHLERLRARRLHQHRAGVGLEQRLDARADQRIEIGGLDAVAGQHAVAEIARGPVDVVADQDVVAGLQHREQGGRDRRQPRRHDADAGALRPLQRHQRVLERPGRRRAVTAIRELAPMGMQVLGRRIEHGRAVEHRRIDEPLLRLGVAAGGDQAGLGVLFGGVRGIHASAFKSAFPPGADRSRRGGGGHER